MSDQLDRFRADPKAALALLKAGESPRDATLDAGELAAYTTLAGLTLNLDEAGTKQFQGRHHRLTDVHGNVVKRILA